MVKSSEMIEEVKNDLLGANAPNEFSFSDSGFNRIINRLEKISYSINNITHKISYGILLLLMFLTVADVLGRNILNKPITGTFELTGLGLAVMVLFSLGMAQMKKEHIAIDFLTSKFPWKIRAVINAFSFFIKFIIIVLTSWQMFEYLIRIYEGNLMSSDLQLPMYIFVAVSSIGLLFFALAIILDFLKSLVKVVEKNES